MCKMCECEEQECRAVTSTMSLILAACQLCRRKLSLVCWVMCYVICMLNMRRILSNVSHNLVYIIFYYILCYIKLFDYFYFLFLRIPKWELSYFCPAVLWSRAAQTEFKCLLLMKDSAWVVVFFFIILSTKQHPTSSPIHNIPLSLYSIIV